MKVTLEDIQVARGRIKNVVQHTEMAYSHSASHLLGSEIFFKHENTQRTGSFKIRGAYNKMMTLSQREKKQGVVASSAGNHAQGVALSARLAQVNATIVMPENASLNKRMATQGYGAQVILHGQSYDDAYTYAKKLEHDNNYVFIHPYEDPAIVAGQGTLGIEMLESQPDLDTLIVPIGGGGLISGICLAAKTLKPRIRVIGVQTQTVPSMAHLFNKQQAPSYQKKISTIADGIAVKSPSVILFEHFISRYVDEIVTVTEDEIAEAIVFLIERSKSTVEGSGAASFAAAMCRKTSLGKKCGIVLSGGNIDLNIISQVIQRGQIKRGRLVELSVVVDDMPGTLSRLARVIAEQNANILEVQHDRVAKELFLRETKIEFVLETMDHEHIERIRKALVSEGGRIL